MHASSEIADLDSAPDPGCSSSDKTEKQKMLAGEPYWAAGSQLQLERLNARQLTRALNSSTETENERRQEISKDLLGAAGEGIWIEPPFYCDYGYNIFMGKGAYLNQLCDPGLEPWI